MSDIRPYRIDVPAAVLDDLQDRLTRTRWPESETVDDWSQGIPLGYTRELAAYWADDYDWRSREAALNRFDHHLTEIDGLDIHFIHQRSPHDDALPLVITHGWPGSVVEFHKVIEPLVNPPSGRAEDAFHVVCPSLPGYGFSGKPTHTGWGVEKIAEAWETLMGRLGYDRYGAQGGDWGAAVTTQIGRNGGHCAGIHLNMPIAKPVGRVHRRQRRRPTGPGRICGTPEVGQLATPSSNRPGRRRSVTGWPTRRWGSWRGSSRSSGRGPTATGTPRTCSPVTNCSTT